MIVYRVVHKSVIQLLTGSGNDGRWCSSGRKVVYTSSSIALACLENILRRSGLGFSYNFKTVVYNIPGKLIKDEINIDNLKPNWRLKINYDYCQQFGNVWYEKKDALILKVPSAIITDEFNYVIKTTSSNINKIKIVGEKPFVPDERLETILKNANIKKIKK